jgi:hypothetical protein
MRIGIEELIERLQEIQEEYPEAEVMCVFQPNYPLIAEVEGITTVERKNGTATVYIGLSDGKSYGTKDLYDDDFTFECSEDEDDE